MKTPHDALRADAQENRSRILDVARRMLTADTNASMNAIAKAAGVGPGTLYRHFPNRDALVLDIYRHDIRQMVDLAPALIAAHPPLEALRLWLDRLAAYGRVKASVAEALHAVMTDSVHGETYGPMVDAIDQLLKAGQKAGVLRPGLDAEDLLWLLGFLWRTPPGPEGEARANRLLDMTLESLKARTSE